MNRNRGIIIPLVIGLMVIAAILFFMISNISMQSKVLIHKSYQKEVILNVADYAASLLVAYINKGNSQNNFIYKDLIYYTGAITASKISCLNEGNLPAAFKPLLDYAAYFGIRILKFQIEYYDIENIIFEKQTYIKNDVKEITGKLRFTINLKFRKTKQSITFVREFKVANLIPPTLSRFTLFVKEPPTDNVLNCINNNELQGLVSGTNVPMVCYNTEKTANNLSASALNEKGWIFLGSKPWYINISSGNEGDPITKNFGQEFHIMPWDINLPIEGKPNAQHNIRAFQEGFYQGMNNAAVSGNFARLPANCNTSSSGLHLYGDRLSPSPTLVIGDVRPRFIIFGCITWNEPAPYSGFNDIPFYGLPYCNSVQDFNSCALTNKTIEKDSPQPVAGFTKSTGHKHDHKIRNNTTNGATACPGKNQTDPSNNLKCQVFNFLYSTDYKNDYIHYMTRIANGNRPYENWNVHYNNSYDRLTVPFKNFFLNPNPQLLLSKLSQHVKPASIINSSSNGIEYYFYNSMVFSAHLGFGLINLKDVTNKTLFDGGLININSILPIKVINGKDTLSQKITNYFDLDIDINNKPITSQVSIPSANRVFDHFFIENDTDLSMNSYTLFSTNKFHFELNRKKLNVKKGGWIISNASIKISNGITNTNTEEGLVICSLNGDIIINTSEPIHASLIALSGKLKKTCDTPFTVKGNICVKAIDKSIFNTPVKRNFTCSIHNNNCWENQLQYADWLNYPYTDQGKYEKMYRIVVSPKNLFLKIKGI